MVKWLDKMWNDFYAGSGAAQVKATFQRCGMLNSMDGSEDAIIQVEGCPNTRSSDQPSELTSIRSD